MTHAHVLQKNNSSGFFAIRQRGISLFELAVVILVLCGVWYALAERLLYVRAQAEKVEVRWVVSALRATLHGRQGEFHLSGEPEKILTLVGSNPMELLERKPRNYLGEFDYPSQKELPLGIWYFDKGKHTLVYVLHSEKYFGEGYSKLLKFKVESSRKPSVIMHGRNFGHAGVALEQLKPCRDNLESLNE